MGKHAGGRPAKYRSAIDLRKAADLYLTASKGSLTVNGLVQALGFVNRQSLLDYQKRGDQFSDTIKRSISIIEQEVEQKLLTASHKNPSGLIFWLKNHQWADRQEVEHSGTVDNIVRFPLKADIGTPIVDPDTKTKSGS